MSHLMYQIPSKPRNKVSLRIPESHSLYVCPSACARRHGLRAIRNGLQEDTSYLRFSQTDVISGGYEESIFEACDHLLDVLPKRPRVISLYVTCIDDFLATDVRYLIERLSDAHPDVFFTLARLNPIAADVRTDKLQRIHCRLYEPIDVPEAHDNGITLVGHFVAPPEQSEIYEVLSEMGVSAVRDLQSCKDFDEYQDLAKSATVLALSHMGDGVADEFARRFGTSTMRWSPCYDIDEISRRYHALMALIGVEVDIDAYAEEARRAVEEARKIVGDRPIAVDSSASFYPFELALSLLDYGFSVRRAFVLHGKDNENEAEQALASLYPELEIVKGTAASAIKGAEDKRESSTYLSIGSDASFLLDGSQPIDLFHDEGCFGFQGVIWLMNALIEAAKAQEGGHENV